MPFCCAQKKTQLELHLFRDCVSPLHGEDMRQNMSKRASRFLVSVRTSGQIMVSALSFCPRTVIWSKLASPNGQTFFPPEILPPGIFQACEDLGMATDGGKEASCCFLFVCFFLGGGGGGSKRHFRQGFLRRGLPFTGIRIRALHSNSLGNQTWNQVYLASTRWNLVR